MNTCDTCNNQLSYGIYRNGNYETYKVCRYGSGEQSKDCGKYEHDPNKQVPKPGMVQIPKTLAREIHDALVSSRKVRETYGCTGIEWMEELYTELEKWRKRYE